MWEVHKKKTLSDKNYGATASGQVIEKKNARPGVSVIRLQSRVSRDPDRKR